MGWKISERFLFPRQGRRVEATFEQRIPSADDKKMKTSLKIGGGREERTAIACGKKAVTRRERVYSAEALGFFSCR